MKILSASALASVLMLGAAPAYADGITCRKNSTFYKLQVFQGFQKRVLYVPSHCTPKKKEASTAADGLACAISFAVAVKHDPHLARQIESKAARDPFKTCSSREANILKGFLQ